MDIIATVAKYVVVGILFVSFSVVASFVFYVVLSLLAGRSDGVLLFSSIAGSAVGAVILGQLLKRLYHR